MSDVLFAKLIGGKITNISRVCNLISIQIDVGSEENFYLHIQSFFRILKNGKIVVSSEDMYRCGKKYNSDNFDWDVSGESVFDDCIKQHKLDLFKSKILQLKKQTNGDFIVILENEFVLQIFIDTTDFEEKYRIFNEKYDVVVNS